MHENQGNSVIFYSHYTEGGLGKTGLTVTVDVYEVIRDGTATLIINDGACTEIGAGLYRYLLASASVDAAAEYVGVFHTATDTVDAQDLPALWVIDRAGLEKLDSGGVPVASIATDALTAAAVKADAVTKIQNGLATPTNITAGTITTVTTVTNAPTDMAKESTLTAIKGSGWTDETLKSIVDNILLLGGGTDLDSILSTLNALIGAGWTDQTIVALKAVIDAIKAKTDNLPSDPADDGDIDTQLAAIKGVVDGLGGLGMGSVTWDYTVLDGSSVPIPDVFVEVSSDAAGTTILDRGITNASGVVTFHLDPGTVYVWRYKYGYTGTNPDTEVVS